MFSCMNLLFEPPCLRPNVLFSSRFHQPRIWTCHSAKMSTEKPQCVSPFCECRARCRNTDLSLVYSMTYKNDFEIFIFLDPYFLAWKFRNLAQKGSKNFSNWWGFFWWLMTPWRNFVPNFSFIIFFSASKSYSIILDIGTSAQTQKDHLTTIECANDQHSVWIGHE